MRTLRIFSLLIASAIAQTTLPGDDKPPTTTSSSISYLGTLPGGDFFVSNLGTLPGGDFSVSTSTITNLGTLPGGVFPSPTPSYLGTLPGGDFGPCPTATVTTQATTCRTPTSTCILFCPLIPVTTTTATAVPWCPYTPTVTSYTCRPTGCYCPKSEVVTTTVSATYYRA